LTIRVLVIWLTADGQDAAATPAVLRVDATLSMRA
jgi:hypothetical protein